MPIPVRAKALGYYGDTRQKPGDVFEVERVEHVGSWMERLDEPTRAPAAPKKAKQ